MQKLWWLGGTHLESVTDTREVCGPHFCCNSQPIVWSLDSQISNVDPVLHFSVCTNNLQNVRKCNLSSIFLDDINLNIYISFILRIWSWLGSFFMVFHFCRHRPILYNTFNATVCFWFSLEFYQTHLVLFNIKKNKEKLVELNMSLKICISREGKWESNTYSWICLDSQHLSTRH